MPLMLQKLIYPICLFSLSIFTVTQIQAGPTPIPNSAFASVQKPSPTQILAAAPTLNAQSYILMDANSGQILAEKNIDELRPPASLTKLMTLYIASKALRDKHIHLSDEVRVSKTAWKTGGSRMFIQVDTLVPVKDLLQGIIVASGNDATVAIAEHIAGSDSSFVDLMNKQAAILGMRNSHFMDSNGLPDPQHHSTARDMATLARSIIGDFPEDYKWYSQKSFTYNKITQPNRNRLLWHDASVDGLKTGHTAEAGYCLVASAVRNGMRLIAVVMGAPSDRVRSDAVGSLLNYGFRFYKTYQLYPPNSAVASPRVWLAKEQHVPLGVARGIYITIPQHEYQNLQPSVVLNSTQLMAPIQKGQVYGALKVTLHGKEISSQPLVALVDDPLGNLWRRLSDRLVLTIQNLFRSKTPTVEAPTAEVTKKVVKSKATTDIAVKTK
ncbi:D-alanyl-D-alanine carboxypeptidase family protein [soil metagenome]